MGSPRRARGSKRRANGKLDAVRYGMDVAKRTMWYSVCGCAGFTDIAYMAIHGNNTLVRPTKFSQMRK
jgi:hypothetical protein